MYSEKTNDLMYICQPVETVCSTIQDQKALESPHFSSSFLVLRKLERADELDQFDKAAPSRPFLPGDQYCRNFYLVDLSPAQGLHNGQYYNCEEEIRRYRFLQRFFFGTDV